MDWDFAIERNREALLGIVVGLFAMIGLTEGGAVERLSRPLYRQALGVLRRAGSAVRRLIIVTARDIVVEPSPKRPFPKGLKISRKSEHKGQRGASFKLFEPPKRSNDGGRRRRKGRKIEPRIHVIDVGFDPWHAFFGQPRPTAPTPVPAFVEDRDVAVDDGTVNASSLCRRLFAIVRALGNLRREAERYARWRDRPLEERRPQRERPLRLGWPPGWRIRSIHEVDEILKECHWLVRSLPEPDTS